MVNVHVVLSREAFAAVTRSSMPVMSAAVHSVMLVRTRVVPAIVPSVTVTVTVTATAVAARAQRMLVVSATVGAVVSAAPVAVVPVPVVPAALGPVTEAVPVPAATVPVATVPAALRRVTEAAPTVPAATVPVPAATAPEAMPTAPASVGPMTEAVPVATVTAPVPAPFVPAGERLALFPAEFTSDLLEGCRHRGVLVRSEHAGDAGTDLVDGGAESLLGEGAGVGESPAVSGALDPAEVAQAAQGEAAAAMVGAVAVSAVDAIQHAPVAAGDALVGEDGGELGAHQAVDGGDPVPEGVSVSVLHGDPLYVIVHVHAV